MSDWIDVTRRLDTNLVCWPGRSPPHLRWDKRIDRGDHCNVSSWELVAHTGTHMDAPLHFVDDAPSLDRIPLDTLIGPCTVVDSPSDAEALRHRGAQRLLIKDRLRRRRPVPPPRPAHE